MGFFSAIFHNLIWVILVQGPLLIINGFNSVLEIVSYKLLLRLMFVEDGNNFDLNSINPTFWIITVAAVVALVILFIISLAVWVFKHGENFKKSIIMSFKNALFFGFFVIVLPFVVFLFLIAINGFMNILVQAIGEGEPLNLAQIAYIAGAPAGTNISSAISPFNPPPNISEYIIFFTVLTTWFLLIGVLLVGIQIIQKVIEVFILLIFASVIAISVVADNMKRLLIWKDMVIAKVLAIAFATIIFYIYVLVLNLIINTNFNLDLVAQWILLALASGGGLLAIMGFSNIIAAFIGESTSIREGMNNLQSMVGAAAMVATGGGMAVKALRLGAKGVGLMKKGKAEMKSMMMKDNLQKGLPAKLSKEQRYDLNNSFNGLNHNTGAIGLGARLYNNLKSAGVGIAMAGGVGSVVGNASKSFKSKFAKENFAKGKRLEGMLNLPGISGVAKLAKRKLSSGYNYTDKLAEAQALRKFEGQQFIKEHINYGSNKEYAEYFKIDDNANSSHFNKSIKSINEIEKVWEEKQKSLNVNTKDYVLEETKYKTAKKLSQLNNKFEKNIFIRENKKAIYLHDDETQNLLRNEENFKNEKQEWDKLASKYKFNPLDNSQMIIDEETQPKKLVKKLNKIKNFNKLRVQKYNNLKSKNQKN